MITLQDTSPMPFGKYKSVPMQDVPASYLHWLWVNTDVRHNKFSTVGEYIRRNLASLQLDHPDGIWD